MARRHDNLVASKMGGVDEFWSNNALASVEKVLVPNDGTAC
jgi:hypothetical protein